MRLTARTLTALSVAALAACSTAGKPAPAVPATFTVAGSVTLGLDDFDSDNATQLCWGKGGFDDLAAGTQVVVSDPAGATIAVGALSGAQLQHGDLTRDGEPVASSCVLSFTVPAVPAGKGFYGVEVSHRGRVQYPEAEVRQPLQLKIR